MTKFDDLKVLWICDDCRTALLFREDGEDHCQKTGHPHLTAYDLQTGEILENKSIGYRQSMYGGSAV
jgi:hypothetical protein